MNKIICSLLIVSIASGDAAAQHGKPSFVGIRSVINQDLIADATAIEMHPSIHEIMLQSYPVCEVTGVVKNVDGKTDLYNIIVKPQYYIWNDICKELVPGVIVASSKQELVKFSVDTPVSLEYTYVRGNWVLTSASRKY